MSQKNEPALPPEESDDILQLVDEDGNPEEYRLLDVVEYENRDFAILLPHPPADDEAYMVHVLEIVEDLDDPAYDNYLGIEDDATIDAVFAIFKERYFTEN